MPVASDPRPLWVTDGAMVQVTLTACGGATQADIRAALEQAMYDALLVCAQKGIA